MPHAVSSIHCMEKGCPMDKVQEIMSRLGELHGMIDGLRVQVEDYSDRASKLEPTVKELEKIEAMIVVQNAEYHRLSAAVSQLQTDYNKMEAHFQKRPF